MYRRILVCCGLMLLVGCAHMDPRDAHAPSQDPSPMIERLRQGIDDLKENLARLRRHVEELRRMPPSDDQTIEELRALDMAGWQLHEQQWQAQVAHLTFALDGIRQAEAAPSSKGRLLQEWLAEQDRFTATLDDLRKQRHEIESRRLQLESGLVQHYLE
jgi:chromosome segregation ATPase